MTAPASANQQQTLPAQVQEAVEKQLLDKLYRNTTISVAASIIVILLLIASLWTVADHRLLSGWVLAQVLILILRLTLNYAYQASDDENRPLEVWQKRHVMMDVITGLGWGSAGVLLYVPDSIPHQAFLMLSLAATASGGIPLRAAVLRSAMLFLILSLIPLIIRVVLTGDFIHLAMGTGVALYLIVSVNITRQLHSTLRDGLTLRMENEALVEDLIKSRDQTEQTNRELESEIREREITAQELIKAKENAELAARTKSEFLATMSHEIRTPMNGVIGMAELLLSSRLSDKQRKFTETILQSGQSLLNIINEILDMSRLESGRMQLEAEDFDLREMLEDVCDQFAERAHSKGLELDCDYPLDAPSGFHADRQKIMQIITNLTGNAIKFTEAGEVTLQARLLEHGPEKSRVRIEIIDTGIGIEAEAQQRIFEPFAQADSSTTRRFGGSGLGLSICQKLCELMEGSIGVTSTLHQGTTFWFELELAVATTAVASHIPAEQDLDNTRVLIVDSHRRSRELLRQQLLYWSMDCDCIGSPETAIDRMEQAWDQNRPYQLVLLARHMPGIDGLKLADTIRHNPALKDTRLVLLSPVTQLASTGSTLLASIDRNISKPVRSQELLRIVCELMGKQPVAVEKTAVNTPAQALANSDQRILVAEDNPVNSDLLSRVLNLLNCSFDTVLNGEEVLEKLYGKNGRQPAAKYAMVLMDCQMPVLDGYETTAQIRQHEAEQTPDTHLPVIALTANSMAGDREKCLAAGMDDYLSKPFKIEQLSALLIKWLPEFVVNDAAPKDRHASTQSMNDDSIINMAALDQVRSMQRSGQPDIVETFVQIYLENSQKLLTEIETAIQQESRTELKRAAHSLKSSSFSVGAHQVSSLAEQMELQSEDHELNTLTELNSVLKEKYAQAYTALHELKTNRGFKSQP